jgi:hypothetical protein
MLEYNALIRHFESHPYGKSVVDNGSHRDETAQACQHKIGRSKLATITKGQQRHGMRMLANQRKRSKANTYRLSASTQSADDL